ncbi:hypothetical protein SR1949_51820 [Sphaerospermopsis reniformis]|uniref:Uncharacterized protein n=1 Tax=Sphaerospermopsis reniformis TaxID=531300 RepID=A0A480A9T1_9CYAN|nr:hypothetical protein SR1949_51820 [Sphaerospermopsis reniformis]
MGRPLLHCPLALIFCSLGCRPHWLGWKVMNHAKRSSDWGFVGAWASFCRFARALRHISQDSWGCNMSMMVSTSLSSRSACACCW